MAVNPQDDIEDLHLLNLMDIYTKNAALPSNVALIRSVLRGLDAGGEVHDNPSVILETFFHQKRRVTEFAELDNMVYSPQSFRHMWETVKSDTNNAAAQKQVVEAAVLIALTCEERHSDNIRRALDFDLSPRVIEILETLKRERRDAFSNDSFDQFFDAWMDQENIVGILREQRATVDLARRIFVLVDNFIGDVL